jgi:TetR/AcrR family transcriptional regulator, transcriptional repressor for nem operon
MSAAAQTVHRQGIERTTIADIARAADVPVGNVYYYYKTKDELVAAALAEQERQLELITGELNRIPDPRDRLKRLVEGWVSQRDMAARTAVRPGRSPPSWASARRANWTSRRATSFVCC